MTKEKKEQEILDCIFELEESNKNLKIENQGLKAWLDQKSLLIRRWGEY